MFQKAEKMSRWSNNPDLRSISQKRKLCWHNWQQSYYSLVQQASNIPPFPVYFFTVLPSFSDHMWMHLSSDALAKYSLFGLNATEYTGSL